MSNKLTGRVAIVTGASKGIGASIAKHLAAEGASVVVNYASDKAGAERVVSEIESKDGKAIAVRADFSKQEEIEQLFVETNNAFGKLDILINNAGVYAFQPIENITNEHFHHQFGINVLGLLHASREAVKYFGDNGGSIVNIGSVAGTSSPANTSVYSATKASVDSITRSLAKELGPRKIRVNALNPGMVETEGVHSAGILGSEFHQKIENETPLGRIGQPDDIAPVAVFFASDDSAWVTGESLFVSGGHI